VLKHFELFHRQSKKEPDKDAHLDAELRARIDAFTLMVQDPNVHTSFTPYGNWWPISTGDKVEKQLPSVVTFYDQIGTTPEAVTRAYGRSWVSAKTGDGAGYPFCYLETRKFGDINCVTVKSGDPIEDGASSHTPHWSTFVPQGLTRSERYDRERLTRDINLVVNLKVALLKSDEEKMALAKASLRQEDTEKMAAAKTPARPTKEATLVTPAPATTPQAPVAPLVATPAEAMAAVVATVLPGLPPIDTAEQCLDFVKSARKEAKETKLYPDNMKTKLTHIAHECVSFITQGNKRVLQLNSSAGGRRSTWHRHTESEGGNSKRTLRRATMQRDQRCHSAYDW